MGVKLDFPERSQWFRVGNSPTIPGVYEVRHHGLDILRRYVWTGQHWVRLDTGEKVLLSWVYGDEWRGLKEKPDE